MYTLVIIYLSFPVLSFAVKSGISEITRTLCMISHRYDMISYDFVVIVTL